MGFFSSRFPRNQLKNSSSCVSRVLGEEGGVSQSKPLCVPPPEPIGVRWEPTDRPTDPPKTL
jgi:hypothetical protein